MLACALVLGLLSACVPTELSSTEPTPVPAPTPAPLPSPTDLPLVVVVSTGNSQAAVASVVVAVDEAGERALEELLGVSLPKLGPMEQRLAVFQGQQATAGYAVRVHRIHLAGRRLRVEVIWSVPGPQDVTAQVLTSPATVIRLDEPLPSGSLEVVVLDQNGRERIRTTTVLPER